MSEEGLVCLQGLVEGVALEVHITGNTTGPLLSPSTSQTTPPLAEDKVPSPSANETTLPLVEDHASVVSPPPLEKTNEPSPSTNLTTPPSAEGQGSLTSTGVRDVRKEGFHHPSTPLVELYTEFGQQVSYNVHPGVGGCRVIKDWLIKDWLMWFPYRVQCL